jgi:hypothetical protein
VPRLGFAQHIVHFGEQLTRPIRLADESGRDRGCLSLGGLGVTGSDDQEDGGQNVPYLEGPRARISLSGGGGGWATLPPRAGGPPADPISGQEGKPWERASVET